jgi:pimeloyl-ACP methyl ester carboxylesterase
MPDPSASAGVPVVLVPGLNCSALLYASQIPALWRFGPVTVADHTRDDNIAAIARRILASAPPRFALAGLSMGGYIAFEILRTAADRVLKLALLDTSARPEAPAQHKRRLNAIDKVKNGGFAAATDDSFYFFVHPDRHGDAVLKDIVMRMGEETGVDAYLCQQQAIMTRADSRPDLSSITCPTLVLVGAQDQGTTPEMAREIAAGISGSRLVEVSDCGHLSTIERPDAVTKALVEWMEN